MDDAAFARWALIKQLLDEAMDLAPDQRGALLDRHCDAGPSLRAEVESLLSAMDASGDYLETPALAAPDATSAAKEPAPGASLGTVIGAWRLTGLLGRGGMGEVCEAERIDGQFQQQVAIKLIRSDIAVSTPRFLLERQIVATLQHPGIARLLDGGIAPDSRPYMVMERVEGQGLRAYCAGRSLNLAQRIALFRQIAEAVAFAIGTWSCIATSSRATCWWTALSQRRSPARRSASLEDRRDGARAR